MEEKRLHPPPPPSTPREAPWRELEDIIDGLKAVTLKLDTFISAIAGLPPGVAPTAITFDGRLDAIVSKLDTLISIFTVLPPGAPPIVPPITLDGRLDALVRFTNMPLEWGKATGGSKDKLIRMGKSWANDIWAGYELAIVEGTGAGQVRRIKTNDRTSLTPQSDFDINPDNTSVFVIRTNRAVLVNKPALTTGQKDVTTAGTAVQLPDVTVPDGCQLTIIAKPGNTGYIYFGNSKANAESSTNRFDSLSAGLAVSLKVTNANLVWIDASVSGEGVSWIVEQ